ncbi:MAG: hypothetical protein II276_05010 [Bacteroidales bacterium]|nr:hypothetical protein [Bacteroidales bacterium]
MEKSENYRKAENYRPFIKKKVEAEELKIRLERAEAQCRQLDGIVAELQSVGTNTDTIVLHTTEIKEVVRESKTTLDTIARKIDAIQKDITEIKRRLQ